MTQQIKNALQYLHNLSHGTPDPTINKTVSSLGVSPQELYTVALQFDMNPAEIKESERQLRIKYLRLLKYIIDIDIIPMAQLTGITGQKEEDVKKEVNYIKHLMSRMINLFIKESEEVGNKKDEKLNYWTIFLCLLSISLIIYIILNLKDKHKK